MPAIDGGDVTGGIPGDPAALEGAADASATASRAVKKVSADLRAHGDAMTEQWTGTASDAADEHVRLLSDRCDIGREVLETLATAVRNYAGELRAAQAAYAAGVAASVAGRAALTSAHAAVSALEGDTGAGGPPTVAEQFAPQGPPVGQDPNVTLRLVGARGQVDAAKESIAAASASIDAAVEAERRANADAAKRVRSLVIELAAMTVARNFPSPHAVDPTNRQLANDPVPGSLPAWLEGQPEPAGGAHLVDPVKAGIGITLGAYDDAAFLAAVGAVRADPFSPVDAWGRAMAQTDAWKQRLADDFDVDLEDEDVLLGEDFYTMGSFATAGGGVVKGVKVVAKKATARFVEKQAIKQSEGWLDDAQAAGDPLREGAHEEGAELVADAAPRGDEAVAAAKEQAEKDIRAADRQADRFLADRPGDRLNPLTGEYFDPLEGLSRQEYDQAYGDFNNRNYPVADGFARGISSPNTIQPGDVLDRFGEPRGQFLAPSGTPWGERGLPVESLDTELHRYKVLRAPSARGRRGISRQGLWPTRRWHPITIRVKTLRSKTSSTRDTWRKSSDRFSPP